VKGVIVKVGLSESLNLFGFLGTVRAVKEYAKSIGFCDQTFLWASVMMIGVDKDSRGKTKSNEN